jgi:hypothetical protein
MGWGCRLNTLPQGFPRGAMGMSNKVVATPQTVVIGEPAFITGGTNITCQSRILIMAE